MGSLSVVVTVLGSGSQFASRCLQALQAQRDAPPMEIIVPLYPAVDDVSALRRAWPAVKFIDIPDAPPPPGPAFEHMNYDRRRAVGLAAATGDLIAMTDDYAIPDNRWCATLWAHHQRLEHAVIGGGIVFRGARLLNRAVYYCDFGRYRPPFPPAAAEFVSASNVCYKRAALESCRDVWLGLYDEIVVHARIRENGGALFLTPDFTVEYDRGDLTLGRALSQKRASGRVFAGRRAQQISGGRRILYALLSPALAPIMFMRMFLMLRRQGRMAPFIASAPFVLLCLLCWSLGEFTGYLTAQPFPGNVHEREAQAA